MGGYTTQRWPEDMGDPPRQAGAPVAGGDAAPAAAEGAAGPDWRAQVGGLQAGMDAQLRRTLADALLLLEPVRLGLCACVEGSGLCVHAQPRRTLADTLPAAGACALGLVLGSYNGASFPPPRT